MATNDVDVETSPIALEFNPSNNNIYVANRDSGTVSVIDSTNNTVIGDVNVETSPIALEFNPSNNNIYVANRDSGTVSVIDSTNNTLLENVVVSADLSPWNLTPLITIST